MELFIFDPDGTLLESGGSISVYTSDTPAALAHPEINHILQSITAEGLAPLVFSLA